MNSTLTVTPTMTISHKIEPYISEDRQQDLEKIYKSTYSTKEYADIYFPEYDKQLFVVFTTGSTPSDIIIFAKQKRNILVINQACTIAAPVIEYFCKAMFEQYPNVKTISFDKQYTHPNTTALDFLIIGTVDNYIIDLPEDLAAYRSMLGKNIKRNMNLSINRLKRNFPEFDHDFFVREDIPEAYIDRALELNRRRMKEKGQVSGLNPANMEKTKKIAKSHGLVSRIILENGEVASVIINTVVDDHLFFHIITHDSQYNYYRLGQVNLYLTIKHFLEQGGDKFHLLWGEYDYKQKFKGERFILYCFEIARNSSILRQQTLIHKWNSRIAYIRGFTPLRIYRFFIHQVDKKILKRFFKKRSKKQS